jgi:hypothetical protein
MRSSAHARNPQHVPASIAEVRARPSSFPARTGRLDHGIGAVGATLPGWSSMRSSAHARNPQHVPASIAEVRARPSSSPARTGRLDHGIGAVGVSLHHAASAQRCEVSADGQPRDPEVMVELRHREGPAKAEHCLRAAGEDRHGHRGLVCVVGGVEVDQAALSDRPVRSTCKSVHPPQRR